MFKRWHGAALAVVLLAAPAARPESPEEIFKRIDANKDGALNLEEFTKYVHEQRLKALPPGVRGELDLEYGPHGVGNRLDLFLPVKADAPLPLVIWIHGGGWEAGDKDGGNPVKPLASKGYAVASINYRLSQEAKYPAQIEDCKAAVRFLRANAKKYNLDPDHIGVGGDSAGGHLVALLGTTAGVKELEGDGPNKDVPSAVQAVVDFYGPTDMLKMAKEAGEKPVFDADSADSPVGRLFGGPIQEHKDLAEKADPIHFITKDAAPFLILHGDKDNIVPLAQSKDLDEALKAAKVESTLIVVEGNGHGGPGFGSPENVQKIVDFFDKHLKAKAKP